MQLKNLRKTLLFKKIELDVKREIYSILITT